MASIIVTKSEVMTTIPFDEYLKLPGHSFSSLKQIEKPRAMRHTNPTPKMALGTMVHNYLLEPHKYEHDTPHDVKKIAYCVLTTLGDLYEMLLPEVSILATLEYNACQLEYRGRMDLARPGRLVVDLKIINGRSIHDTMHFFGYEDQVSGYMIGSKTPRGIIIAYSTKTGVCEVVPVPLKENWWKEKIITNGIIL